MLALTKKIEYAMIALTHLARSGQRMTSAREISDRYGVPLPLLMNVLKTLTQRGLVRSIRGARGGYVLAVPVAEITLEALVLAIEGPIALTQCIAEHDGTPRGLCELTACCPVRGPMEKVNEKLREFLRLVTLAEIAEDRVCCHTPPMKAAAGR